MSNKEKNEDLEIDETLTQAEQENTSKEQAEATDNKEDTAKEENPTQAELDKTKQELAEMKDKYLRLFAEFDNFRKRTSREKLELRQTAAKDTLSALLPLIDDFARAKKEHENEASEEHFTEGVQLLYDKLQSFMVGQKLEPIDATGEVFDADFHEAITEIPAPTEEMKGKVIDTIERGYKLNDKIIRYARVVVGK